MLKGPRRLAFFTGLAALLLGGPPAVAEPGWMHPEAVEAELLGKRMRGYFFFDETWTALRHAGGHFEMCQGARCVEGRWLSRSRATCIVSGPPYWPLEERCTMVRKLSANCYEFHLTS